MSMEKAKNENLSFVNPLFYGLIQRSNERARKSGEALRVGEEKPIRELSVDIPAAGIIFFYPTTTNLSFTLSPLYSY